MRDILLNLAASGVMAALLLCLALRAWRELLGGRVPGSLARFCPAEAPAGTQEERRVPGWAVFCVSLAVLWAGVALAYLFQPRPDKSVADFFSLWYERFTVAGDAPHYLYLAENGYQSSGEKINLIVFYPLYPFLMGLLGRLLGRNWALAGMLISQLSYGLSTVLFYALARQDLKHPRRALWAYRLYPLGFFALGVFTEGLFLLLSVGCLYALRREKWGLAGLSGFFCLLCRVQGIALIPVFAYAVWRSARQRGWKRSMLSLAMLPAGWGIYLLLNRIYCGDFFAFQLYESLPPWWQSTQWLGKTIAQQVDMALRYPFLGKIIYWPQLLLYFIAAALLFAALTRGVATEWVVYGGAYLGMCYLAGWLISGGRYMLGCLGMYAAVGAFRRRGSAYAVLAVEGLGCAWFYYYFMNGQSIM